MEVTYDIQSDSKYVQIKKGVVASTKEDRDWLFFDCNKEGEILGIEILDASKHAVNILTFKDILLKYEIEEVSPTGEISSKLDLSQPALSGGLVHQSSNNAVVHTG